MGPDEILTLIWVIAALAGLGYWLGNREVIQDARIRRLEEELEGTDAVNADQSEEIDALKERVSELEGKGT